MRAGGFSADCSDCLSALGACWNGCASNSSGLESCLLSVCREAFERCSALQLQAIPLVEEAQVQATPAKVTDCGDSSYHGKIVNYTISPNPPKKGGETSITGSGTVDEAITAGSADLTVTSHGVQVLKETIDICEDKTVTLPLGMGKIVYHSIGCPTTAGAVTVAMELTMSSFAPSGEVIAELKAVDQNKENLLCAKVDVTL